MSAINQKEYLRKYLSLGNEPGKKKKRKKKSSVTSNRVKIIDDDVDVTFNEAVEEDLHGLIEDAPQIVGVIDDRPLELRMGDYRDSDLWKPVTTENSIEDIANNSSGGNATQTHTENRSKNIQKITDLPSHKYSDDYSPPRKRKGSSDSSKAKTNDKDLSKPRERERNYDLSPVRTSKKQDVRSNRRSSESSDDGFRGQRNASPPRKRKENRNDIRESPVRRSEGGDISPPRRNKEGESPRRRNKSNDAVQKRWDSSRSPARKNKTGDIRSPRKYSKDYDTSRNRRVSDLSPERKNIDRSPARRNNADDDMTPPRKNKINREVSSDRRNTDRSPARRRSPERRYSDRSPVRRNKLVDDMSPPRKGKGDRETPERRSPARRNSGPVRRNKKDDDMSPPRKNKRDRDVSSEGRSSDRSSARRSKMNNDVSPSRRYLKDYDGGRTAKNDGSVYGRNRRNNDVSTSRSQGHDSNRSPSHGRRYNYDETRKNSSLNSGDYVIYKSNRGDRRNRTENNRSPPGKYNFGKDASPTGSRNEKPEENPSAKPKTTSSGAPRKSRWDDETPSVNIIQIVKKSGLQRANELIEQHELFKNMKDMAGPSGAVVAPIVRDRKTGKIRDFKKEEEEAMVKQEKEDEMKAKYDKWGKGLKQVEDATEKISSELHEMSKPLARYADDEDLERHLKEIERDGDPMLDYLRKKKRRKDIEAGETFKPQFEGEFMPNRYGIGPGHRWDGVDRSNGYEKKWFEVMNARRAQQEEAYKWSTEDM